MKCSLDDYLQIAGAQFPAALADREQMVVLSTLARNLPPTSDFGFEARLRSKERSVDFFARIRACDGSRRAYAGLNPYVAVPDAVLAERTWRQLRRFCRRWQSPNDPLHSAIDDMWLEFDAGVFGLARPTPCVFFHLPSREVPPLALALDGCRELLDDPSYSFSPLVKRCLDGGLGNGWAEHIGLMMSRPDQPLRLVIVGVQLSQVVTSLAKLGWFDESSQLASLLDSISTFASSGSLAIDVADRVLPRIGVEFFPPKEAMDGFGHVLTKLVEYGLARSEKAEALRGWRGLVMPRHDGEVWPANLRAGEERLQLRSSFRRQINHFKLSFASGAAPEVKAYFGLTHQWLRLSTSERNSAHA